MDQYQRKANAINKELKALSKKLKTEGHPNYHNEARAIINKKYGKHWRSQLDSLSVLNHPENHRDRFKGMSHY